MSATMGGARIPVRLKSTRFSLPAALPPGERVLWQGAPDWRSLARNVLHLRGLTVYFGILVAWVAFSATRHGAPAAEIALDTGRALLAACVPLGVGLAYAWLSARASAYTITNKRVVIRMGLALPMTLNLPFTRIDGAGLSRQSDGTGDIALQTTPGDRNGLGWFIMWPHTRPWHFTNAQPTLRALPDAARASQILARALAEAAEMPAPVTTTRQAQDERVVDSGECQDNMTPATA